MPTSEMAPDLNDPPCGHLGLVLTGGGARGGYQVGVLNWLAQRHPELCFPIITGVSAGAVNAGHLAAHHGTFRQAMRELVGLWTELRVDNVFHVDTPTMAANVARWGAQLVAGGLLHGPTSHALLDTSPLARYLEEVYAAVGGELTGIDYNLKLGHLRAVAISTTNYNTSQSVVWVQGRQIDRWTRPKRISREARLTVDHIMASTALPLFFPAIKLGEHWYGDGGIRQTAPLSPALHLGARRILAISTRYGTSQAEGDQVKVHGYPPPAQILGTLLNAIFLDLIDQDELRLERLNQLLLKLPPEERNGLHPIRLLVVRPSRDLGRLARAYEPRLPRSFRFLTRGLGTRRTRSSDMLSMLMFQEDYLSALIELGEHDAEARAQEIDDFIGEAVAEGSAHMVPALPAASGDGAAGHDG